MITPGRRPEFGFLRASQGYSFPFIVEGRPPAPRPDFESLVSTTTALRHCTQKATLFSILGNGLIPSGARSRRKAVYLCVL